MKGQNSLVSQIVAQGTKIKPWEFVVTKTGILSIIMHKYRTLVLVINLISILQSGHLNESVLLLVHTWCHNPMHGLLDSIPDFADSSWVPGSLVFHQLGPGPASCHYLVKTRS